MRLLPVFLTSIALLQSSAFAARLTPDDAKNLEERARLVARAFDSGDVDTIVTLTHPSLFELVGGREKMVELTNAAIAQLKSMDFEILESEMGIPGEIHIAGDELVCIYPRTSVMRVGDKRAKSTGFLICVRKADGGEWLFLDGSGLRKNPGLLGTLLPSLAQDVKLPENSVKVLE